MPEECPKKTVIGFDHDGALAQYLVTNAAQCVRVPDHLASEVAALAEPCAVAHHACRVVPHLAGRSAVVVGAGSVGMLVVLWLQELGVSEIAVVEPNEARRKVALSLGAHLAVPPEGLDDLLGRLDDSRPWALFECAGRGGAVLARADQLPPSSWIVLVGISSAPIECDVVAITLRQHTVRGINAHARDLDVLPAVRLLARRCDAVRDLVEVRRGLDAALALLIDGLPSDPPRKIVVVP
ncbi:hypothetical protein A6V29_07640 [Blastococcus sp. CCUG 61487]|nr:hypothetical protein A6V29_07640 [Blastococcus sp. CCUG 61487]